MRTTSAIQRLCESWWEKLADSTREDQHLYAEKFLALLGWNDADELEPAAVPGHPTTLSYVIRSGGGNSMVAYFVLPGVLDPPSTIVKRGLDFCPITRALTDTNRVFGTPYAFVTDLFRSYLYDTKTDELLLYADTPAAFTAEFGDVLLRSNVEASKLDEVRRQPRSYVARQLREWIHRWTETLMSEWRAPEEAAWLVMDRLVTVRFLAEHDILRRPGASPNPIKRRLTPPPSGSAEGCGQRLTNLFRELFDGWGAGMFAPQAPVEAILEQDAVAGPLMSEMALLSRSKFSLATVLESFNYGDAAEKARVRMIPEDNEERQAYLAQQTCASIDEARIELDLADEGYRAIFRWFDQLVELYARLSAEFDMATQAQQGGTPDLDLFDWSELNAKRPRAFGDGLRHAIEQGLLIYCSSPRQFRTARLMLYLHIITRYEQGDARFSEFPTVETALQRRPHMLDSDRRRIFQGSVENEWEVI
jgi:hypothetical protein